MSAPRTRADVDRALADDHVDPPMYVATVADMARRGLADTFAVRINTANAARGIHPDQHPKDGASQ